MKQNQIVFILQLVISGCIVGCSREIPSRLDVAMDLAKGNCLQIERVLEHYRNDSLKREAALFLIENMPGHVSYADTMGARTLYDDLDEYLSRNVDRNYIHVRAGVDSIMESSSVQFINRGVRQDIEIVTADFLIKNIDSAFRSWESTPWTRGLNFEEFCEWILPYKVEELQPLDNWRGYLYGRFDDKLGNMYYCDLYTTSAVRACINVGSSMRDFLSPDVREYDYPVKIMDIPVKMKMPYGICADYSYMATAVMRSEGIPVAMDFTPLWGYRSKGHSWNAVMNAEGKWIPFGGVLTDPGEEDKLDERMGKVFRKTYSHNREIDRLIMSEKYIPRHFRSPFQTDVTASYIPCGDLQFDLEEVDGGYVYLAQSERMNWEGVDFAKVEDGKAVFHDVGFNNVYSVVRYDGNGNRIVVDGPFLYTRDGGREYIIPSETEKEEVRLWRKYPSLPYLVEGAMRIIGGEFQASNRSDFNDYEVIHKIDNGEARGHEYLVPDDGRAYRYWRYIQDREGTLCNISEIVFYGEDGKEIRGEIIGTEGACADAPESMREKAFDGDLLTIFDAPTDHGSWVGMDFGSPVSISRIHYTGRGDGNSIERGHLYELFYFKDGDWHSLGKQTADGVYLDYKDVPVGGLLFLRDHTKGKEERIFKYEDGKQRWM